MSRTRKDTAEYLDWLHSVGYPYKRDRARSGWNRAMRRNERERAAQALRNGREPLPKFHRPYFW